MSVEGELFKPFDDNTGVVAQQRMPKRTSFSWQCSPYGRRRYLGSNPDQANPCVIKMQKMFYKI